MKQQVMAALLQALDDEIDAALRAADAAHATASDKNNQPENKYDTLSLEAAYLAHGQSERIAQLQQRLALAHWQVPAFSEDSPVNLGALLRLEWGAAQRWLFLAPVGGRMLKVAEQSVWVVSPKAPLAQRLLNQSLGEEIQWPNEAGHWEIAALS